MKSNSNKTVKRMISLATISLGPILVLAFPARNACAQTPPSDGKPTDSTPSDSKYGVYQTLYLTNITATNDANDLQTDLRNMLPNAKLYYVPSQSAISLRGTPEDIALAKKILADLDHTKKIYRLTYTITDSDSGKRIGTQHFTLVVASGGKSELKQGSKVPIVLGATKSGETTQHSDVQYVDVGLDIEASLDAYSDGVRLRSKLAQSSVAEEKSNVGMEDPVIRQTTLEGTSTLVQGKPLVLGSLDIPGSTRHQEVEVVSELVR
jgi:type II secretory pathway component GspD/PulD (secretin)